MYNLGEVQLLRNLHVTHCPNFINASKIYMHMQMKITQVSQSMTLLGS